jgi:hypothetical protein
LAHAGLKLSILLPHPSECWVDVFSKLLYGF